MPEDILRTSGYVSMNIGGLSRARVVDGRAKREFVPNHPDRAFKAIDNIRILRSSRIVSF